MKARRWWAVVGIGGVTLAAALSMKVSKPSSVESSMVASPASLARASVPRNFARAQLWQAGSSQIFAVDYSGTFSGQEYRLVGELRIDVLDSAPKPLAWVSFTTDPSQPSTQASWLDSLRPSLNAGVLVNLNERGFGFTLADASAANTLGIKLVPQPEATTQFWQTFGERLHLEIPADDGALRYQVIESVTGAVVTADYEQDVTCNSGSKSIKFSKSWINSEPNRDHVVKAKFDGSWRSGCQGLEHLNADIDETFVIEGQNFQARSQLRVSFRREEQSSREVLQRRALTAILHLTGSSDVRGADMAIDRAVIRDLDESQLMALLRQQDGQAEISQQLYFQLKSWIAVHPESIATLREMLREWPAADQRLRAFVKALGAVGSPEAQSALISLIRDYSDYGQFPEVAARMITTLGFVAHPTAAAAAALLEIADKSSTPTLAQRAILASGIVGSHLRQSSDPEEQKRAADLEKYFDDRIKSTPRNSAWYDYVAALGNLGPTQLPPLKNLIEQATSEQQAQIFYAMRFSPSPSVIPFLVESFDHYQGEGVGQERVRSGIVKTLADRAPDAAWLDGVRQVAAQSLPAGDSVMLAQAVVSASKLDRERRMAILGQLQEHSKDAETKATIRSYQEQL